MIKLSNIEFTAFVGLDWADSKHDICVQAAERCGWNNWYAFLGRLFHVLTAWTT